MAPMPPRPSSGVVTIIVKAESEDDQQYEWRETLSLTEKVSKVAHSWASAHGVPSTAVGFDDLDNNEVPLTETPAELGWTNGQEVELKAFPTEDRFMEQGQAGEEEGGALPPAAGAGQVEDEAAAKKLKAKAADAEPNTKADDNPPEAANSAAAPAQGTSSSASRAKGTTASTSKQEAKTAPARGKAAAPSASSRRGAAAAAPAPTPPADPSAMPGDAEEIVFQQVNPKREGSSSHTRYEQYKFAKTVAQALTLGAVKGDIAHDWKRGFLKRKREH